jgi:hypothetical protein
MVHDEGKSQNDETSEVIVDENQNNEAGDGQALEDQLYSDSMGGEDSADDKNNGADSAEDQDEGEKSSDDDGDKKGESVEDDDLLGIETDDEDDKSKPEEDGSDDDKSDEKKSDDEGEKGDDKSDAPESYELQLSENSLLDDEAVKQVEEHAKKHGLSQEAAADALKLKEQAVSEYQDFLDRTALDRAEETVKENKKAWLSDAKADPDIGGDNFNETVARANKYLKAYGDKETFEVFKKSGMGNHKVVLKLLSKGASHLMSDSFDNETTPAEGEEDFLDAMYPSMKGR